MGIKTGGNEQLVQMRIIYQDTSNSESWNCGQYGFIMCLSGQEHYKSRRDWLDLSACLDAQSICTTKAHGRREAFNSCYQSSRRK
jgi:hypothetical protein